MVLSILLNYLEDYFEMADKQKTGSSKKKVEETKEAKFVRVVTPRIAKAVKYIDLIGNCACSGYSYSPEEVEQIADVLKETVNRVIERYSAKRDKQADFAFKSS